MADNPDASAAAVKLPTEVDLELGRELLRKALLGRQADEQIPWMEHRQTVAQIGFASWAKHRDILTLTASHAQLVETVERLTVERDAAEESAAEREADRQHQIAARETAESAAARLLKPIERARDILRTVASRRRNIGPLATHAQQLAWELSAILDAALASAAPPDARKDRS